MSRVEDALMRLYEAADLRDELTDDEANAMLKWAEGELTRVDQSGVDDAGFLAKIDTLMQMLKTMNRFAGRQGQFSAQADDQTPVRIAEKAAELGHALSAEQIAQAATGDPAGTIAAITALLRPSEDEPIPYDDHTPVQPHTTDSLPLATPGETLDDLDQT
jgi:hypothetical protein